jgi:hypothetical protein
MLLKLNSDKRKNPEMKEYRSITLEEAKNLDSVSHCLVLLNNGNVGTVKINGKVKRWKREIDRIEIPIKYGLYEYTTLDNTTYQRLLKEII